MQPRTDRRVVGTAAIVLVAALAFGGCGSSTTTAGPPTTPSASETPGSTSVPAATVTVTIDNFAFSPATLDVAAGTTVTWTNKQDVTHTVTADDGSFDSGNIASGDTFSHTFDSAGTIAYHCAIHPTMKASIVVTA